MGGNNSDLHSVGGGGSGRNRAFSFECFAFGINADEPLPPLEQSTSNGLMMLGNNNTSTGNGSSVYHVELTMGRPRGDSIIFDPVSFQDGGILEQHALERSSVTTVPVPTAKTKKPTPIPVPKPKPVCAPPSPLLVVSSPISVLKTSTSHPARSTMSFAQQQSGDLPTISADGSLTLSLELLNKDGRIGIYLPEARRARIARFHAKRSKRIWRKRIKYDCRKKLADSRPRIKGRFVKRSDMDDDF